MVRVIDNRALVTCRVQAVTPAAGHLEAAAWIEAADDVAGYPNLLRALAGTQATLRLDAHAAIAAGMRVAVEARLAGPGVVWADARTLRAA